MKRLLLIFPLLLIIVGCVELEEERKRDDKVDFYSYYTQNPQYSYNLKTEVETVENYPQTQYVPGQTWTFIRHLESSDYIFTEREKLHLNENLNQDSIHVTLYHMYMTTIDSTDYYGLEGSDTIDLNEEYVEEEDWIFASYYTIKRYIPIPLVESPDFTPTYIKMDNGSVCYRSSKNTVYSSQYGVLFDLDSLSNNYYSSVVQVINNNPDSEIPYLINEFLAKEQYLANN